MLDHVGWHAKHVDPDVPQRIRYTTQYGVTVEVDVLEDGRLDHDFEDERVVRHLRNDPRFEEVSIDE